MAEKSVCFVHHDGRHLLLLTFFFQLVLFSINLQSCYGFVTMFAPINTLGLSGNITFRQENSESITNVAIYLSPVQPRETSINYKWKIMSNPYYFGSPCSEDNLGRPIQDMSTKHGPIQVVSPNLGGIQSYPDQDLSLFGRNSIWLSSIIIQQEGGPVGCSNILLEGSTRTAQAQFLGPTFSGTITVRENENKETVILSQLTYTENDFRTNSQHDWKILVADILDTRPNTDAKCHYLDTLLDGNDASSDQCSTVDHGNCKIGDLTKKHGQITIYSDNGRGVKQKFIDSNLPLEYLESTRPTYFVIFEKNNPNMSLACALISPVAQKQVKANFDMDGVKGYIGFSQTFNTDPTIVTVNLQNLKGRGDFLKIHQFPVSPRLMAGENICAENVTGTVYNPFKYRKNTKPGQGSNDQYQVGDLSGKYGPLTNQDENGNVFGVHVDLNLPLFGRHSIIGRSLVIHKTDGEAWICATIGYPGAVTTAVATFHSPVVGSIIFRQMAQTPGSDTTVFVDLSYSAESINDTTNHAWHVHVSPPGADWRNWTARCLSTQGHYNPSQVGVTTRYNNCNPNNPYRCKLGDLTAKAAERISIAGHKGSKLVKLFYTDPALHLYGSYSIIGRSVVIYDENGPQQRGNRLACAPIKQVHPLTAATRSWRCANALSPVSGYLLFHQNTQLDGTSAIIELEGLNKLAGGFHVHEVSVPIDREFPCSMDSTLGHFDPLLVGTNISHYPGVGSSDQYEIGDISGKTGTLNELESYRHEYIDYNLPLFGVNSIVGRSIVIHKAEKNDRWVCGSIRAEVKRNEGKEIVALASFHDPRSLIIGYVRFRQFQYIDGSTSDTWIDVDLRHAGKYNRNITNGHRWEVYVNQVGADAFQPTESVRCVAGGYRWDPQLKNADAPLYRQYCTKANPLRCQLGDLSGRNGYLEIGGKRRLFTDINLPLIGPDSVVGRSLIIFRQNDGETKMACANIGLDVHHELTVSMQSNPTFTVAKFMDYTRNQLRTTEWQVVADTQSHAVIHDGDCITLTVHFYGPSAFRLQNSFSNLMIFGTTEHQDDQGNVFTIKTPYKSCNPLISEATASRANPGTYLSYLGLIAAVIGLTVGLAFILRKKF
ncbi:uncharacterized protein LOC128390368 [Panonychus citri]|uniref:uncharacterized protein LOC128390368 n=1 Tax=Panonychus citri TaxID=50023 RepID=UPI00230721B8|nr:uncharacterized protein LOC128390368 [Panonychus citri]